MNSKHMKKTILFTDSYNTDLVVFWDIAIKWFCRWIAHAISISVVKKILANDFIVNFNDFTETTNYVFKTLEHLFESYIVLPLNGIENSESKKAVTVECYVWHKI